MKKEVKGFVSGMLVMGLAIGLMGTASATVGKRTAELDYNDIKISVNGQAVTPTDANGNAVEPFAINGTTYLPVRAVGGALGMNVDWDRSTNTAILSGGQRDNDVVRLGNAMKLSRDTEEWAYTLLILANRINCTGAMIGDAAAATTQSEIDDYRLQAELTSDVLRDLAATATAEIGSAEIVHAVTSLTMSCSSALQALNAMEKFDFDAYNTNYQEMLSLAGDGMNYANAEFNRYYTALTGAQ